MHRSSTILCERLAKQSAPASHNHSFDQHDLIPGRQHTDLSILYISEATADHLRDELLDLRHVL